MFDKLNQIIQEDKNYNTIANYIVENDIDLGSFLIETLEKISSTIEESEKKEVDNFLRILNEIGIPYDVAVDLKAKERAAQQAAQDSQKPGFFKRFTQGFSNLWNNFRGNPRDTTSVVNILKKAQEYLGKPELKDKYSEEIAQIAKAIESINSKQSTST
jgi:hypothetical protein